MPDCSQCGKPLDELRPTGRKTRKDRRFCSAACRTRRWYEENRLKLDKVRTCSECGEVFMPAKSYQRFCSTRCRNRFNRGPVERAGPSDDWITSRLAELRG